jgi:hypothetical protein
MVGIIAWKGCNRLVQAVSNHKTGTCFLDGPPIDGAQR